MLKWMLWEMHQFQISIASTFKYLFFPQKFLKYALLEVLSQYNWMCVLDFVPHKASSLKFCGVFTRLKDKYWR